MMQCEVRGYIAEWTCPTAPSTRSEWVRKIRFEMWGARGLSVEDSSNYQVWKIVHGEFSPHRHKNGSSLLLGIYLVMPWNRTTHLWKKLSSSFSKLDNNLKNWQAGISLVTQWLRIRLPMQGTWVRSLVREDPTCRGATKPVRHNYWACALEPMSHNYWAHVPQLLKPVRLEPELRNKRNHCNEKPAHRNKE